MPGSHAIVQGLCTAPAHALNESTVTLLFTSGVPLACVPDSGFLGDMGWSTSITRGNAHISGKCRETHPGPCSCRNSSGHQGAPWSCRDSMSKGGQDQPGGKHLGWVLHPGFFQKHCLFLPPPATLLVREYADKKLRSLVTPLASPEKNRSFKAIFVVFIQRK